MRTIEARIVLTAQWFGPAVCIRGQISHYRYAVELPISNSFPVWFGRAIENLDRLLLYMFGKKKSPGALANLRELFSCWIPLPFHRHIKARLLRFDIPCGAILEKLGSR